MKHTTLRIFTGILALCVVINSGAIPTFAAEAAEHGKDIYLNSLVTENEQYLFIGIKETDHGTTVAAAGYGGENHAKNTFDSRPEREVDRTFTYDVYDRNGVFMARLVTNVKGVYSQADGYALVSSVTGCFSGSSAHNFSYFGSCSGNMGIIYINFGGASIASFSYRINTNGSVQMM